MTRCARARIDVCRSLFRGCRGSYDDMGCGDGPRYVLSLFSRSEAGPRAGLVDWLQAEWRPRQGCVSLQRWQGGVGF